MKQNQVILLVIPATVACPIAAHVLLEEVYHLEREVIPV